MQNLLLIFLFYVKQFCRITGVVKSSAFVLFHIFDFFNVNKIYPFQGIFYIWCRKYLYKQDTDIK